MENKDEGRSLRNEELHNLYYSLCVIRIIKLRNVTQTGYAVRRCGRSNKKILSTVLKGRDSKLVSKERHCCLKVFFSYLCLIFSVAI
jgi:hypothetical protein